ncbi:2OG-Fe(II) oxygenase [Mucilaginibacter sp. cycad4]|uniref:2OG-Fe(II) oxygenase n=1 Tax=Mucilaginibacter sp. cycad4 TaxID=3342096 RepID=UPI002AAB654F|nr:2OG-Fe(II) oxygenase [Mucilaginibacter gossypii]WPV02119.1 2OG-Fe(II) oxygenase [Mucilaginibacter gossypii]
MQTIADRLKEKDWVKIREQLNGHGFAAIPAVVTDEECNTLMEAFKAENHYRKTVVMERYRFGKGVYKYFTYPLPDIITELREQMYEYLAPVANKWMEVLKINQHYPQKHDEFIKKCRENGQEKATALILGYGEGGWCAMHQDLYGEVYFPMQILIFLDDIDTDYTGGEFVLTENIPMAQSRTHVLKPKKGDIMAFTTNFRPAKGAKGYYRVTVKHGVATIASGNRHTLGIIFHDAKS